MSTDVEFDAGSQARLIEALDRFDQEHEYPVETDDGLVMRCACGATPPSHLLGQQVDEGLWLWKHWRSERAAVVERLRSEAAYFAMWHFFLRLPVSPFSDIVQREAMRLRAALDAHPTPPAKHDAEAVLREVRSLADIYATGGHAENVLERIRRVLDGGRA